MTQSEIPVFSVQRFTSDNLPDLLARPGGLPAPEQATVFALEGYSLGDDGLEPSGAFDAGRTPAMVALLDDEIAQKVFAQLNTYLHGRRAPRELAMDEREAMAALWPARDGKRLLMVADAGNDNDALPLHQAWEEIARTVSVGAYEEGVVEAHHRFDATRHTGPGPVGQALAAALSPPASRSPAP